MLTFFALLAGMADPLRKMSDIFSNLQAGFAAADRIFARLDREPQVRDPKQPVPFDRHHRDLVFENVGFAYQPGKPVLEELNSADRLRRDDRHCRPERLRQEHAGQPGSPLRRSHRRRGQARRRAAARHAAPRASRPDRTGHPRDDALRRHDFQQHPLRPPKATREQVIEAAKQAHAHRFIEHELPEGYETPAGALGNCLSGGQRQRIALARAILRDPAILILDEATSQVDLESEQAIQQVLEKFTRDRTTILITHRLAVLRWPIASW